MPPHPAWDTCEAAEHKQDNLCSSTGRTVPSSSLLIWPVQRALVCRCTVLVAGVLSLAVVGVRPGARNWFARAFSVDEDWEWGKAGSSYRYDTAV